MIYVCSLSAVDKTIREKAPSHLISLLDPHSMIETPEGIESDRHLKLGMNDVATPDPGFSAPAEQHIRDLIQFARNWDTVSPMLIHCWAGISRSTAAALIVMSARNASNSEHDLAQLLRDRAPHAHPNRLMIDIADRLMEREGRLIDAVEKMGSGALAWRGKTFELPSHVGS